MIVPEPEEFIKQLICNFLFYILKSSLWRWYSIIVACVYFYWTAEFKKMGAKMFYIINIICCNGLMFSIGLYKTTCFVL